MLTAQAIGNAEYYLALAVDDYFLDGGEPPGQWFGRGSHLLGLSGLVAPDHLRQLIAGFDPVGVPLIQNAGKPNHQAGWDLTCSAPKPVSVIWCAANEETRYEIQKAHFDAVKAMLRSIERNAAFTRRGKRGSDIERVPLVAAAFEHGTSRALDPQLHTHLLIMNVAPREDGSTGTILSLPLYQFKMVAGALYRAELAANLRTLGFAVKQDGTSFVIEGLPAPLIKHFSKRREQIEDVLGSRGMSSAKAAAVANLITRDAKKDVARSELFDVWQAVARGYGVTADVVEELRQHVFTPPSVQSIDVLIKKAIKQLVAEQSHFNANQLLRRVAEGAPNLGACILEIEQRVEAALHVGDDVVYLGELDHDKRYTTEQVLRREEALLTGMDRLHSRSSHVVPRPIVTAALGRNPTLRAEQQWAIEYLTAAPGDIKVVDGMPGTGKTFMLSVCREIWEQQGFNVIGCSISAKATRELSNGMGIPCFTTAKLFHELDRSALDKLQHHASQLKRAALGQETFAMEVPRLDNRTVVVLDEAGMGDTRTLLRLQQEVEQAGGVLVLIGDRRQIPAVGAGGGFEAIGDHVGRVELTQMSRQQNPLDTLAVQNLAESRVQEVLCDFQERGILQVAPTRMEAMEQLVNDWKEHGLIDPRNTTIITSTNAEVAILNRLCQEERLKQEWHNPLITVEVQGERFVNGDRVLFLENNRQLAVDNGDVGTITAIDPLKRQITVQLDRCQEPVVVDLAAYDELQLGYAKSTHKEQGATFDHVYVLMGGTMQSKEISFVQVSRHVESLRIYVDQLEAGENLENLAAQLSASRAKHLAHSFRQQVRELSTLETASLPPVHTPKLEELEQLQIHIPNTHTVTSAAIGEARVEAPLAPIAEVNRAREETAVSARPEIQISPEQRLLEPLDLPYDLLAVSQSFLPRQDQSPVRDELAQLQLHPYTLPPIDKNREPELGTFKLQQNEPIQDLDRQNT